MEMSRIQVMVFAQSLVTKIKSPDMELTRVAPSFRNAYKKARGLGRNANALVVLKDLKVACDEIGWGDIITKTTERYPEILAQL